MKKALILSLGLHLVGFLGGELFLKRARLKNKKIIYPIRLIEIAESSPKPAVRQPAKKKSKRSVTPIKKTKPKVVKKKSPQKPPEPKKGVPIKKEAKKEKEQKKIQEEINKDEEKKVSKAIEDIKKALALKEKTKYSEISKKFIERQLQIYAAEIYSQIERNWSIPEAFSKDMGDFEAIVIIRLNSNGELADVRLEKASGFHPFDESIIRAIKKAAPFPAPPLDLKEDELEFEIGFHSNEMG